MGAVRSIRSFPRRPAPGARGLLLGPTASVRLQIPVTSVSPCSGRTTAKPKRDLNVHRLRASIHGGVRELPAETTIPGQIAAPLLLLDDGRLLAFVVDRGRPGTMTLWQFAR